MAHDGYMQVGLTNKIFRRCFYHIIELRNNGFVGRQIFLIQIQNFVFRFTIRLSLSTITTNNCNTGIISWYLKVKILFSIDFSSLIYFIHLLFFNFLSFLNMFSLSFCNLINFFDRNFSVKT